MVLPSSGAGEPDLVQNRLGFLHVNSPEEPQALNVHMLIAEPWGLGPHGRMQGTCGRPGAYLPAGSGCLSNSGLPEWLGSLNGQA